MFMRCTVVLCALALGSLTVGGVSAAAERDAAALSPLARATQCYANGMMGCVIEVLSASEPAPAQAPEHLRMLAFALARIDRFD